MSLTGQRRSPAGEASVGKICKVSFSFRIIAPEPTARARFIGGTS